MLGAGAAARAVARAGRHAAAAPTRHAAAARSSTTAAAAAATPAAPPPQLRLAALGGDLTGTTVLTLDRPAAKNALGRALLAELAAALQALRFDPAVRVVVLTSAVAGVFCAGADLKERASMSAPEVAAFVHGLRAAFSGVAALPMPVIAAIEGAALGGGCELALACDFRVAGEGATLGLPETGLAIIPGAGGTQRLPRLVGVSAAKELIFTGRRVGAPEAAGMGLVDRCVPPGQALEGALGLARAILPRGPLAVRAAKAAIDAGLQTDLATGLAIEQACYAQVIPTADRLEGLAAFAQKRAPVYRGE